MVHFTPGAYLFEVTLTPSVGAGTPVGVDHEALRRQCSEDTWAWFARALGDDASAFDKNQFLGVYAGAGRRFGPLGTQARQLLVRHACSVLADAAVEDLVDEIFYRGDNQERAALLAILDQLPEPARFCALASEACRTNVQSVFEAIACNNDYPARFFDDDTFNQMVLKALFIGTSAAAIRGLDARQNPDLIRMAEGYASERRAANRPVPQDVALITRKKG